MIINNLFSIVYRLFRIEVIWIETIEGQYMTLASSKKESGEYTMFSWKNVLVSWRLSVPDQEGIYQVDLIDLG